MYGASSKSLHQAEVACTWKLSAMRCTNATVAIVRYSSQQQGGRWSAIAANAMRCRCARVRPGACGSHPNFMAWKQRRLCQLNGALSMHAKSASCIVACLLHEQVLLVVDLQHHHANTGYTSRLPLTGMKRHLLTPHTLHATCVMLTGYGRVASRLATLSWTSQKHIQRQQRCCRHRL
jgi:hypothetical protein